MPTAGTGLRQPEAGPVSTWKPVGQRRLTFSINVLLDVVLLDILRAPTTSSRKAVSTWKPDAMTIQAKIITVFNQKGGCGKSTTTMALAGEFGRRGYKVQVMDIDPQATSSMWRGQATERYPFPASVVNLSHHGEAALLAEIQMQAASYEVILIDCPPAILEATLSAALLVSDLALLPVQPSPADIWALQGAKALLSAAQRSNTTLQARVVPIRVMRRQRMTIEALEILNEDAELPATKASIGQLSAYTQAMAGGRAIHDVPDSANATKEVEDLANEVSQLIGLGAKRRKGSAA